LHVFDFHVELLALSSDNRLIDSHLVTGCLQEADFLGQVLILITQAAELLLHLGSVFLRYV